MSYEMRRCSSSSCLEKEAGKKLYILITLGVFSQYLIMREKCIFCTNPYSTSVTQRYIYIFFLFFRILGAAKGKKSSHERKYRRARNSMRTPAVSYKTKYPPPSYVQVDDCAFVKEAENRAPKRGSKIRSLSAVAGVLDGESRSFLPLEGPKLCAFFVILLSSRVKRGSLSWSNKKISQ